MTRLDVFGGVMYLLFFAPFLFPLAPWFAKRPRGAWLVCCAAVSVLVLLFPAMFWWGCDWSNCGQGAVAILVIAPVWLIFAVITPLSAWAAARYRRDRAVQRHPGRAVKTTPASCMRRRDMSSESSNGDPEASITACTL